MEKKQYIKYFLDNYSWFNLKVEDFIYLGSLKIEDYNKPENQLRVLNILTEFCVYATIYDMGFDIAHIAEEVFKKTIPNNDRFEKMYKVSETCYSYMKMLMDEACDHPMVKAFDDFLTTSHLYDEFFDTIYNIDDLLKIKEFKEYIYEVDDKINTDVFLSLSSTLATLAVNHNKLPNNLFISMIADKTQHAIFNKILEVIEEDKPVVGYKLFNYNNAESMFVSLVSPKPTYFSELLQYLEKLKNQFGYIEFTAQKVDYSKYDYNPNKEDDEYEDYFDSEEPEEKVTLGTLITFSKDTYLDYKKSQLEFLKSQVEVEKIRVLK